MDKQEEPKKSSYYSCTAYKRPKLPDILPYGYAGIAVLYASQASPTRRVNLNIQPAISTRRRRSPRGKPILAVLFAALLLLGGVLFWQQAVTPTWSNLQDQWHYGDSHVTQMDADVGHGGMSHFLAEYYQGNIVVIEISLSNPNNTHVYTIAGVWNSESRTPVIQLALQDSTHNGKPDLRISVEGTNFATVLYNNGTAFQQSEG